MIDVDKLNKTINELEQQAENIGSVMEVFKQLSVVTEEVVATTQKQEDNTKQLNLISSDLNNLENEIINDLRQTKMENNKLLLDFQNIYEAKTELLKSDIKIEMRNNNDGIIREIDSHFLRLENEVKLSNNKLDDLKKKIEVSDMAWTKKFNLLIGIVIGFFIITNVIIFLR